MRLIRGVTTNAVGSGVNRDHLSLMEQRDLLTTDMRFQLLLYECVWHRVVMFIHLNVIIDVNAYFLDVGVTIGLLRKGLECRLVDTGKL